MHLSCRFVISATFWLQMWWAFIRKDFLFFYFFFVIRGNTECRNDAKSGSVVFFFFIRIAALGNCNPPCANGGTCIDDVCQCPDGFRGPTCTNGEWGWAVMRGRVGREEEVVRKKGIQIWLVTTLQMPMVVHVFMMSANVWIDSKDQCVLMVSEGGLGWEGGLWGKEGEVKRKRRGFSALGNCNPPCASGGTCVDDVRHCPDRFNSKDQYVLQWMRVGWDGREEWEGGRGKLTKQEGIFSFW